MAPPRQLKETKPEESLPPKAQTPELQDDPQREIEARGPETMYRVRGGEEGTDGGGSEKRKTGRG